jgi:hypothetical protein
MNWRLCPVLAGILLACALALAGCGNLKIESVWRDRDITIDGSPAEWDGLFPTYVEAPNIAIRAMNDDEYLYLCVSSPDRNLAAQMLTRGFTVWFDPKGHDNKVLGIHYPLGMHGPLVGRKDMRDREEVRRTIIDNFLAAGEVMEVLRSGEDEPVELPTSGNGIEIKPGYASRSFIYEIRVPLKPGTDSPYAIGSEPGRVIGLGFETAKVDFDDIREAMGRDVPPEDDWMGGDAEGIGEGSLAGTGPPPGIRGPHDLEGLSIWARLALAAEPDSTAPGGSTQDTEERDGKNS